MSHAVYYYISSTWRFNLFNMEFKSILVILTIVMVFSSEGAVGISRSTVISNAKSWLNPSVPYSQSRPYHTDGYRRDCSGYVSMAWGTGAPGYNTVGLSGITTPISKEDLKSGDILLKSGSHVTIFESWTDSTKTKYWGYEQVGGSIGTTKYWQIPYPYWKNDSGYFPRRYKNISA